VNEWINYQQVQSTSHAKHLYAVTFNMSLYCTSCRLYQTVCNGHERALSRLKEKVPAMNFRSPRSSYSFDYLDAHLYILTWTQMMFSRCRYSDDRLWQCNRERLCGECILEKLKMRSFFLCHFLDTSLKLLCCNEQNI